MKIVFRRSKVTLALFAMVALSACSETRFFANSVKQAGQDQAVSGNYKIGKPYQIKGVWYYPAEDFEYEETGIASWYGPQFHGKPTANGEVFDMNQVSAAHRTLPLPSLVRVTNLENGRSLVVRVNDRGPFAHGRILDMSKRGAELLGYAQQGTARVKVEILHDQSLALKNSLVNQVAGEAAPIKVGALEKPKVTVQSLDGGAVPSSASTSTIQAEPIQTVSLTQATPVESVDVEASQTVVTTPVSPTRLFIQAGAFSRFENANRVKNSLSSLGSAEISQVLVDGRDFFRVRLGPIDNVDQADRMLENVIDAGYSSAKIIVEKGKG